MLQSQLIYKANVWLHVPSQRTRRDIWNWNVGRNLLATSTHFSIEGTGSYGAGLSRSLLEQGHNVVEVTRPNRQLRYLYGKSDSLDAESAARSVLNGQATAIAKTQTGSSEMIRHLKVARDSAVKAKSQAMITLKALIVNAPAELPVNRHAKLTPNRRPILPPPCAKQARRCVVPMQRSCGGPAWLWPGAMLGS